MTRVLLILLTTAFANPLNKPMAALHKTYPPVDFTLATATDANLIKYTFFGKLPNLDTKVLIHGWRSSGSSSWFAALKQSYQCNVIFVDWSAYGGGAYNISAANVKPVGHFVAQYLQSTKIPPEKLHLIGHSLGGHLAGFVGKTYQSIGKRVGRITALDPAGPLWTRTPKVDRLNELDADFVDVIHTDVQIYGYTAPCGHVDYYPNGGTDQPGCNLDNACNHLRAPDLFIESVTRQKDTFEVTLIIEEDLEVKVHYKTKPTKVVFGEHINKTTRGVFYLETAKKTPYLA